MGERVFNITGPCVPLLYTGEEIPYQFNNPEIENISVNQTAENRIFA